MATSVMVDPHALAPSPEDDARPSVRYLFAGQPPRTIFVDRTVEELWGVPWRDIHGNAGLWLAGIHEEDRQRVLDAWQSPDFQRWDLVYRVVRPDGSTIWVRDHGLASHRGELVPQLAGRVFDITAQHELEERLRFHSQLLDAVGQAVVATDTAGTVTFWNRAAERLFGWRAADAIGRDMRVLVKSAGGRRSLPRDFAKELHFFGEHSLGHKDGSEIVVETRTSPVHDDQGRVIGRIAVSTDISARREAVQRLRESEERFRAVFEHAGIGIAICGPDGRLLATNAAFSHLVDYEPAELVGREVRALVRPDDWEAELPRMRALLAGEIDSFVLEKRYRRCGGEQVWGRVTVTSVLDEAGRLLYLIRMVENIDVQRRAAVELRASQDELRRLYTHLHGVREQEQTRIARDLHDQLGQMLTALKLDVEWLRRRASSEQGLQREQASRRLEQTAQLVDETLDAMRRITLQLRPVVLDDLGLEAAIEWLVDAIGRRAGIEWTLDSELADLPADHGRDNAAYHIVQEALTNVARHAAARRVRVRVVHRNGELRLSVRDDGRGIASRVLRAPGSMGIAGMRERARAFGGRLTVRRLPGGGTRVSAQIPDASPGAGEGAGKEDR